MKKSDFLYPDWMTTSTIPCQPSEQTTFCLASFRPGKKMTRPRNFFFTSSSFSSSPGSDFIGNTDGHNRMNSIQILSGPDISGFDKSKPVIKNTDKRASFPFIDKAFYDHEREEKGSTALSKPLSFKTITFKNSMIRGEQLLSYKTSNTTTASETDETVSVDTLLNASNINGSASSNSTKTILSNGLQTFNMATTYNGLQRKPPVIATASVKQTQGIGYNGISNGFTIKQMGSNFNSKEEPKYADPLTGATASFQQRLMELAALEAETIRWERTKKVKKKTKDRDS